MQPPPTSSLPAAAAPSTRALISNGSLVVPNAESAGSSAQACSPFSNPAGMESRRYLKAWMSAGCGDPALQQSIDLGRARTPFRASGPKPRLMLRHRAVRALFIAAPLALFGCRDPKVAVYRVPKEAAAELPASAPVSAPMTAMPPGMGGMPAGMPAPGAGMAPAGMPGAAAPDAHALATAAGADLVWTAPAGWQSKQGSMMRKATYAIPGEGGAAAELAVTAFPGDVGGEVANVNRWRGQVGLAEIPDADALAAIQRVEANGLKIGVVDVAAPGANATRMLGAMVPYQGATWFFKLLGPDATVAAAKPAFLEFLKTVKPAPTATP